MPTKYITIKEAQALAENEGLGTISTVTIRKWILRYGLGRKVGGRFVVDPAAFDKFVKGEK